MESRVDVLKALVRAEKPVQEIRAVLVGFPWDSESLVELSASDCIRVLQRYIDDHMSDKDMEEWANAIESRDDIEFFRQERAAIADVVYELANPYLTNPLSKLRAQYLKKRLKKNSFGQPPT